MSRTRLLLVVFLVAMSAKDGHGIQTTTWTKRDTPLRNVSLVATETSPLDCARQCSRTSGCVNFCVDESNSLCYFDHDDDAPSLVTDNSGLTCYNQTYYASSYNVQPEIVVCPFQLGYVQQNGRCMKLLTSYLTYDDAKAACSSEGGHLYFFKSFTDDGPPLAILFSMNVVYTDLFWLGGDDIAAEGTFRWEDGTIIPNEYPLWISGEPSLGVEGLSQDCIYLSRTSFAVGDIDCTNSFPSVCQIDL